jgi:hypothetical protein
MDREILISAADVVAFARLFENETARAIWEALPLNGTAHRWGEEIYFDIPVVIPESEDARQEMQIGELAYWPVGNAFCIFFGRTPISEAQTPKAYANVNPFGIIEQNAGVFTAINDGTQITISKRCDAP